MARAIERIERDIAVLQEAIQAIATELQAAYAIYLTNLGQALRKQLILATYHLCTQGYPDNFLELSLNQRQQLQQGIRKLGQQAAEILLTHLVSEEEDEGDVASASRRVGNGGDEEDVGDGGDEEDGGDGGDLEKIVASQMLGAEEVISVLLASTETLKNSVPQSYTFDSSNPIQLAKWQQYLEEKIQSTLRKVSHDANVVLQKAGILPKKLPQPILDAAAAASEASAEMMPGPPNLLNLVIEIENGQDTEESNLTQIMTINLRLGEIEFADATVSANRRQIRDILVQLNKLGREYQKKQKEHSIAEAESAWRASWYED
ncbi:hypothetical protein Nos7524_0216 [Nostoc sp. PCC 7524]|uniref:hypothetical protein n=1 Tax=Nostoc sp. (strain ATCC 29411 / PCC 7524) TaxID=28072 RepID=UPI00029F0D07|nr:hypothetical protein [Nostoc sp. PCC 7524]AFY46138.1 hypothetical protein Nos7524_0216 [Nostoc sp. PCC 7524]